jgi:hypothetical protein
VYFTTNNVAEKISKPPTTTLTAFFEFCKTDSFAKTLLYHKVPTYYTYNNSKFNRKKRGTPVDGYKGIMRDTTIGRVYTMHPNNTECFYLRILLHTVPGPISLKQLKTVNGQYYFTFQSTCLALGLLEDDKHWDDTMSKANLTKNSSKIQNLFAILISFCQLSEPFKLWNKYKNNLSDDFKHKLKNEYSDLELDFTAYAQNKALISIEDQVLSCVGKSLKDFGLPKPHKDNIKIISREYLQQTNYNITDLMEYVNNKTNLMTTEKNNVFNHVINCVEKSTGNVFFLDAPGGTGKTFIINLLLAKIRSSGKIAIGVASSGIASTLIHGGKTAHSMFKLPIDLNITENLVCDIKRIYH